MQCAFKEENEFEWAEWEEWDAEQERQELEALKRPKILWLRRPYHLEQLRKETTGD